MAKGITNRQENDPASRREFLRMAATLVSLMGVTSLLEACAPTAEPTPAEVPTSPAQPAATSGRVPVPGASATTSPYPTATPEPGSTQVALVKTRDRTEGVRSALALLGLDLFSNKNVLLKPNFNSAHPCPGSTHNDVLRALIQELRERGARAITVADRSGMGSTREVMEDKGVFAMAEELDFETLVFDELEKEQWVMMQPAGSHWRSGFPFAQPLLEADAVVQTCCLKTHRFGGHFTLSLKNSVGIVGKRVPGDSWDYMGELHASPHQRLMIAEINTAYVPALIVLDGVEAFVNRGPESGKSVWAEVVLAGTDRVAIDAVGVAVLRSFGTTAQVSEGAIFRQEQIARAVELDLGVDGPGKIEFVTGDAESEAYAAQIQEILASG
jgi:uncharacterized protein (DUF362 family)